MSPKTVNVKLILSIVYTLFLLVAGVVTFLKSTGSESASTASSLFLTLPRTETLDSIGGLRAVKEKLRRTVLLPLRFPRLYAEQPMLRAPRGTLLCGPPGTGKTMLARALAVEANVPFMALHPAALENKWWGESPKILAAAFEEASKAAPSIMFFDEIDGIGRVRSEQDQSCVYSFKCELLRHMDGIQKLDAPIAILACTNCKASLDPALQRRFGQEIRIPLPDEEARLDILRKLTRHEAAASTKVLRRVAAATAGKSGSDLASLFGAAVDARLDGVDLEEMLGGARDGAHLAQTLGPLTLAHWNAAGAPVLTAAPGPCVAKESA